MNISFEKTIGYLLDLADIPEGELPERAIKNYRALYHIASHERVNGYIASWILDNWNQYLDDELKCKIISSVFSIKFRNMKITEHVLHLSSLFLKEKIPALFLKGTAGMMRDLYPLEARLIGDIDILIPEENIISATQCLQKYGYIEERSIEVPSFHHHLYPLHHPDFTGNVEIHYEPYDFSMLDRPAIPDIWGNAESVIKKGIEIQIPTITDHVWIFMRSHAYNNVYIPNFHKTLEYLAVIQSGSTISFDTLLSRSANAMLPNLMDEVYYTSEKYFEMRLKDDYELEKKNIWESWSYRHKKRELHTDKRKALKRRFACIHFLNGGSVLNKLMLLRKIVKYEIQESIEKSPPFIKSHFIHTIYRYSKDSMLVLYEYLSFLFIRLYYVFY